MTNVRERRLRFGEVTCTDAFVGISEPAFRHATAGQVRGRRRLLHHVSFQTRLRALQLALVQRLFKTFAAGSGKLTFKAGHVFRTRRDRSGDPQFVPRTFAWRRDEVAAADGLLRLRQQGRQALAFAAVGRAYQPGLRLPRQLHASFSGCDSRIPGVPQPRFFQRRLRASELEIRCISLRADRHSHCQAIEPFARLLESRITL